MRAVTDDSFDADVLRADRPVVVDFCAPWCRPCKAIEPVLDELASAHGGRVDFVRMDVDANPRTAARYGVLALPTVTLFESGEPRTSLAGARRRDDYESAWAAWLSRAEA